MQQATKPLTLRRAVNVVIRRRRLEKSRKLKMARQFEALTDPTFLDRAVPREKTPTEIAIEAAAVSFRKAGVSIAEIVSANKRRQNNRRVYSKNRNIVQ